MLQLLIGATVLSLLHAIIPNHWMPMALIAHNEKWSRAETFWASLLTALAHITSTIAIGVIVGLMGLKASEKTKDITSIIASVLLITFGTFYFIQQGSHKHATIEGKKKSRTKIILTLSLGMFISPCLEIEAFYFTAGTFGTLGIWLVTICYLIITVSAITALSIFGYALINKLNWHFFKEYEKKIIGVVLIILGIITFFIHP